MGYINSAQQVFVDVYGLGGWFPVFFGAAACALALAAFVNSRLVMRLGMRRISHAALLGFAGVALRPRRHRHGPRPAAARGLPAAAGARPLLLRADHAELQRDRHGADGPDRRHRLVLRRGGHHRPSAAGLGLYVGQQFDGTVYPLLAGFASFGLLGLAIVLITERGRLFRIGH